MSANKGFDEIRAMDCLNQMNKYYKNMMMVVPDYQRTGINVMCENWHSKKGKDTIIDFVGKLNCFLDKTTSNLKTVFDIVNKKAAFISKDGDGIGYRAVRFVPKPDRFNSSAAFDDVEAGGVAQWDEKKTKAAVDEILEFTNTFVLKNISCFVDEICALSDTFAYSEEYISVSNSIKKIGDQMSEFYEEIEKSMDIWQDNYDADAKSHQANVGTLTSDIDDALEKLKSIIEDQVQDIEKQTKEHIRGEKERFEGTAKNDVPSS